MDLIDLSAVQSGDSSKGEFLDQLCDELDLDYANYASLSMSTGTIRGYANYPDVWKQHYMQNAFHLIDPTVAMSARSIAPVDWARVDKDEHFRTVFQAAHDYGITSQGLTVPVRGPYGDCGLLSVTRNCTIAEWNSLKRKIMGNLQTAAVHFHDSVMQEDQLARVLRTPQLSTREKEILQWIAAGKTQQDVGDILSISHRTVEVHLRSAREKLGALTTPQAIGRAIRIGMVQPR
jgi:DNA-binding CsgD family transcriptional regulator